MKKILPFFFFFAVLPPLLFADIIYLKNENSLEGVIVKENGSKITLNVGYGIITLDKRDIKDIYRYEAQKQDDLKKEWSHKYFSRPEFIPGYLRDIAIDFNNMESLRNTAAENRKKIDEAKRKIEELEKELKEANDDLAALSAKLSKLRPEDNPTEYNLLVNTFNSLIAKIKLLEYNKEASAKEIISLEQKISGYLNDFGLFKKRFAEINGALREEIKNEQCKYFFEGVNKKMAEMDGDFRRHSISYSRYGSSIIVETLLNDTIRVSLILDTGASLVVISQETAAKLGLDKGKKTPIAVTLADGKKTKANLVVIKNIKVSDAEAKNVQAAVLENSESASVDGLLGMSFLENFLVNIDAKSNKLILQEFSPS